MEVETPYELLKDDQKKKLDKNNRATMTIYNALPRKEYERVFMCKTTKEVWHTLIITNEGNSQVKDCKTGLLTQQYKKFSISSEETIDSGFIRFNVIVTSLKSLDQEYSRKNHVRKEQVSNDSDSQRLSDEDIYEEEAEAFNLMARNFRKFFHKGNRFGHGNRFGNGANRFGRGSGNNFGNKRGEISRQRRGCYNYGEEGHFINECPKPKENKAFFRRAWSDSEDDIIDLKKENEELLSFNKDFTKTFKKLLKEKRSLESEKSKILSKVNDLELKVKKLGKSKEVIEPFKKGDALTKEVDSLRCSVSRLQDEALDSSKFKKSNVVLDNMISRQKLSQDKEGLRFSKNDKNHFHDWIMDCGFTKHMTRNIRMFTLYKAYDGGHVVFGRNLKGKVISGCNISHDSITITNVEHVSGLAFNLISVGQLCDNDCVVSFTKVDYNISNNGKMLAKGHRRSGLYT
ncbi:zf-CCHC domain-containing protein [Tanacetum coccineum]